MEQQFFKIQTFQDEIINSNQQQQITPHTKNQTKYIIINSEDRNWNTNEITANTPYNYRVVFGNNSFYSSGSNSLTNLNILVNDVLHNVKTLTCQKIIVPNRELSDGFRPSNQAYLLLNIDNIEQVSDASNNKLQNALSVLTPKIPVFETYNSLRYLEFENVNKQIKLINQTIPYMDIKIQRADGTLINKDEYQNDILNIEQIVYDTSNLVLDIKTGDYFHQNDFKAGDIIKIRDYSFRESSLNYYETALFNDYINRSEGHIIQSIAQSNSSLLMYDIIKILPAGVNSKTSGDFEVVGWFDDLITKTNVESNVATDDTGKLINTNLQTSVFLKIECL